MNTEPKKKENKNIETLDMSQWLPSNSQKSSFDLQAYLFQGLILKEKDFRDDLKDFDWSQLTGHFVAVYCSSDAIIPMWAYMLVSAYLESVNAKAFFCSPDELNTRIILEQIEELDPSNYSGSRIVVKGCGEEDIRPEAYVALTRKLTPVTRAFSFGEACSTVPIWRQSS